MNNNSKSDFNVSNSQVIITYDKCSDNDDANKNSKKKISLLTGITIITFSLAVIAVCITLCLNPDALITFTTFIIQLGDMALDALEVLSLSTRVLLFYHK